MKIFYELGLRNPFFMNKNKKEVGRGNKSNGVRRLKS